MPRCYQVTTERAAANWSIYPINIPRLVLTLNPSHFSACWQFLGLHLQTEYRTQGQFCPEEQALLQYFLIIINIIIINMIITITSSPSPSSPSSPSASSLHWLPSQPTSTKCHLVPHTISGIWYILCHLIFSKTLWDKECYFHFTNKKTEAQRD